MNKSQVHVYRPLSAVDSALDFYLEEIQRSRVRPSQGMSIIFFFCIFPLNIAYFHIAAVFDAFKCMNIYFCLYLKFVNDSWLNSSRWTKTVVRLTGKTRLENNNNNKPCDNTVKDDLWLLLLLFLFSLYRFQSLCYSMNWIGISVCFYGCSSYWFS